MNTDPNKSVAHAGDWQAKRFHEDGLVPWREAKAPDLECGHNSYTQGHLRHCQYCGSMHPTDLVAAIQAGAQASWADFKYGWPHKAYVEGITNPFAGMRCSTSSCGYGSKKGEADVFAREHMDRVGGEWVQLAHERDLREKKPEHVGYSWHHVQTENPTTHGKFYTVHLLDATPEEKAVIEKALGLVFTFTDSGGVRWRPFFAGN